MSESWSDLLAARYGKATDDERLAAWSALKQALDLGDSIDGEVIAVAPFGAWIDFGCSIPGLQLISRFNPPLKPVGVEDMPQQGDTLRSRVISFNEEAKTVVLSQNPHEEVF